MSFVEAKKVGELLRQWRGRRRLSQLDLAYNAEISPKHLSFLETGRAQPSREMLSRLAEQLKIPLRARNILLTSAGFAPIFPERTLEDNSLDAARKIVELILSRHEPNPSLAVDRHWNLIAANKASDILLSNIAQTLLKPPVNILRVTLHPQGIAPQIINYDEWRERLLDYLRQQIELTADSDLFELFRELKSFPKPGKIKSKRKIDRHQNTNIAVPLQLRTEFGELSFLSTVTVFGTPIDITLAELTIESFFPADEFTNEVLSKISINRKGKQVYRPV